ncbi:MAG: hypothetical protein FJ217_04550 [Ignavibacteria bacterium]|nr:hypothetical protein [Ignavibacteria bacterium]
MEVVRSHIRLISPLLLVLLLVQIVGCASFVPLEENEQSGQISGLEARLRVLTRDQLTYVFPSQQYTLVYGENSTISEVKGWGDKYSSFGLIDKGYFEITRDQIRMVEIEKVKAGHIALIAGAVVGLSVLAYVGVKAVEGDAGSGRGKAEGPPQGN